MSESSSKDDWRALLRASLGRLPKDYHKARDQLAQIRRDFLTEVAEALEKPLNAHLKTLPQESLAEKREIATSINRDLHSLNLCVKCPATGLPAVLVADYRDHEDRSSRFRFVVIDAHEHRMKRHTVAASGRLGSTGRSQRIENLARHERTGRREPPRVDSR